MIQTQGQDTVQVTKVKGHATDADVQQGRVRLEDQLGNTEADAAADSGRRHQSELLLAARRILLKVRNHWYPKMRQLHGFMIAVTRVAVKEVLLLIHLSGIRVEGKGRVGRISGLMLILPLCLVLLVS